MNKNYTCPHCNQQSADYLGCRSCQKGREEWLKNVKLEFGKEEMEYFRKQQVIV